MLVPILIALFIVVPLAELYVIIQVGNQIGVLNTIGILILDSLIGSLLLRSQGRAAWRRFNQALQEARPPAREVLDGVLVIFGGAFLLTPGFLTDIVGIVLLIPPTRALVRRLLVRVLAGRVMVSAAGGVAEAAARSRARNGSRNGDADVDGTAIEVDPPELRPGT